MADRVELIIQLTGDKEALSSMQNLQRAINSMRNSKIDIRIDQAALRKQINDTRSEIRRLQEELGKTEPKSDAYKQVNSQLQDQKKHLQELQAEYAKLVQRAQENSAAIAAGTQQQREFTREAQESVVAVNALGNALQAAASASSTLGRFAEGIGQAFTGMASVFQTNIIDTVERTLTYMATRGFVGSLGNAVSRYDILNTFSDYMQLAGVQANIAEESLQRVNDAILGLPIGLDEAAQRLRRYQMFLGDVERATNLTIGIQNALFAGGANEAARQMAYYQIDRLLTTGELNIKRQWNALLVGLGVSARYIAEEMGFGFTNVSDFASALSGGKMTEDFLAALERLGTGTTEAGQNLQKALDVYKGTIDSWMRNISFAFQRGTANVMSALNESLDKYTGQGIVGYMSRIRGAINEFYGAGSNLIRENPELLTRNIGAIERLLSSLGRFSGSEIATGVFENFARVIDMLTQALNRLPVGTTEQFVAFATTIAGPLGKLFATVSSGLPVMLGVFQRFKDFDFADLLDKIITEVERLASVIHGLLSIIPDGLMGDLIAMGLVWGKPLATVLTMLSSGIHAIATALVAVKSAATGAEMLAKGGILAKLFSWLGIGGAAEGAGGLAAGLSKLGGAAKFGLAGLAGYLGYRVISGHLEDERNANYRALEEEFGNFDIEPILGASKALRESVSQTRTSYEDNLAEIGATAERVGELSEKILSIDEQLKTSSMDTMFQLFAERELAIQQLSEIDSSLAVAIDEETGVLKENSKALLENNTASRIYYNQQLADAAKNRMSVLEGEATDRRETARSIVDSLNQVRDERIARQARLQEVNRERELLREQQRLYGIMPDMGGQPDVNRLWALDTEAENLEKLIDQDFGEIRRLGIELLRLGEEGRQGLGEFNDAADVYVDAMSRITVTTRTTRGVMTSELAGLIEDWNETFKRIEKTVAGQFDSYDTVEPYKATPLGDLTKGLNSQVRAAEQYTDAVDTVFEYIEKTGRTDLIDAISGWGMSGRDAAPLFMGLADVIKRGNEKAIDDFIASGEAQHQAAHLVQAYSQILADSWWGMSEEQKQYLQEVYGDLGAELITAIENSFNKVVEEREASYNAKKALLERRGTFEDADGTGRESIPETFIDRFVKNQRKNEKAVEDFFNPIIDGAEEAKDSLTGRNGLSNSAERLARVMEEKRSSADNLASSISNIGTQANIVVEALTRLKEAFDALQDKEVNLTVNTTENTVRNNIGGGGRPGGTTVLPYATGGFLPRGTDTIAALLSPGEFVMRKGAVDAVGGAFLSRLNSLDIRGAIDSMMSRYYRPSPVATATSYTTNSYDNRNITVNQNVRTNNPRYANRRIMSRFAHAL